MTDTNCNSITLVLSELDWFERNPTSSKKLSWNYLVKISGKSRTTLWRNVEVRNKFKVVKEYINKVSSGEISDSKLSRLSDKQRILRLEADVIKLNQRNERLIETMLSIYQHFGDLLDETGFDLKLLKNICDYTSPEEYTDNENNVIKLKTPINIGSR